MYELIERLSAIKEAFSSIERGRTETNDILYWDIEIESLFVLVSLV